MLYRVIIILCCAIVSTGCGYDDFGTYAPSAEQTPLPNIDIGDLVDLYDGTVRNIYDDLIFAGYVTANDLSGNFYRSFMLEDGTGAVEVRAGTYDLHNLFFTGRYVVVRGHGLVLGNYNGILQLGVTPVAGSGDRTDYFSHYGVLRRYVLAGSENKLPVPVTATIAKLDENMCGRLVRISGLQFMPEEGEESTAAPSWAVPYAGIGTTPKTAYRVFTDAADNRIAVVTSGYANFAGETVPAGTVSLTGILSFGQTDKGRMYMLRLRDLNDVE